MGFMDNVHNAIRNICLLILVGLFTFLLVYLHNMIGSHVTRMFASSLGSSKQDIKSTRDNDTIRCRLTRFFSLPDLEPFLMPYHRKRTVLVACTLGSSLLHWLLVFTKAKHGKKVVEQTSLRASISAGHYRSGRDYWVWVGFDTRIYCQMCKDDDKGMLSELEIIKKNGKKSGVLKKWDDTLCWILSQYDAFEGAVDCVIDVDVSAFTDYAE
jgi:hypothetical protein